MAYHILAVDDDCDLLRMSTLVLQNAGYQVTAAAGGRAALEVLQTLVPDLVILDVMMPDISGIDVCRWLRVNQATARVPVIMLTAKTLQHDKASGYEAGADDYLAKPVSYSELLARIKSLLRRAQSMPSAVGMTSLLLGVMGIRHGCGVSTVASNLAAGLAAMGKEVISIDLGAFRGLLLALTPWFQPAANRGTLDTCLEENGRLRTLLARDVSGLWRPVMPIVPAYWEADGSGLTEWQVNALLCALAAVAPCVVLDVGSELNPLGRAVLALMDRIVVVSEPDPSSLEQARILIRHLRSLHRPPLQIAFVSNHRRTGPAASPVEMERYLTVPLLGTITQAPEACFLAEQSGLPVVSACPGSAMAEQIRSITLRLA